ncbi:MAG TPA: HEAT repeat domain-containing protein, partial [Myxococcaceae bacterium]|nr:HEAT repeat domain-containing protein [Myxococcaceae bacterium]
MSEQGLNAEEVRYQTLLELDVAAEGALEALVAGLHDESWRVRRAAAEGFARLPGGEGAVARLIAVLGERDETGARNAAAEALAGLGEVALGPLVRLLLEHEDPDQRKFSADILGHLDRREAEEALVKALLEDADLNVRVAAAEALGRVGAQAGARALERVLHVSEPLLQLSALESLAALRCPPPLPEVVRLLGEAPLRRSAYRVLGLIPQVAATELLCRGLGSESRSVREAALVALGLQAGLAEPSLRPEMDAAVRLTLKRLPDAAEWLACALEAEELELRAGALVAAGALREPRLAGLVAEVAQEDRLLPEVVRALSHFGPEAGRVLLASLERLSLPAREAAGQALVGLVDASYVLELVEMLEWGEHDLKRVAVQALGRTRSLEAVAPLAGLLDCPELAGVAVRALMTLAGSFPQEVSRALEEALARGAEPVVLGALVRVGGTAMLPLLRRTARDASPPLRATAVEVLAAVDPVGSLELARVALADEAPRVRAAAVRVLGQLGDVSVGSLLKRALHDEAQEVLLAAVDALGECGAAEHAEALEGLVQHPEGAVAFRAVQALARLGMLRDEVLRRAVSHADPEVVKAALQAGAASEVGVSVAVGLRVHAGWDVRAAAARVL